MMCQRCSGLLVRETYGDLSDETTRLCPVTRCVNCGCMEDSVIRANRLRPQMTNRSASHRRVRNGSVRLTTLKVITSYEMSPQGR